MKTLVVCSGGLDSVSLAHKVARERTLIGLISFDYGQRHRKELDFAAKAAARLGVPHDLLDISAIGRHLSGSALTDAIDVPDGHYAEETMRVTVVPNRNAIMLAIAFGIAAARGADAVAAAVHGGDHFIYPDCRPGFIDAFQAMQDAALEGMGAVSLYTPFVNGTKGDIVREGARAETPFAETWSCYRGGETHCGRCGTCVERREAFHEAGVTDPTIYDDPDFWLAATGRQATPRQATPRQAIGEAEHV
ncbi:7-cyano-7-deazaguanine synthase QueC [Nitratireductor sp. GISD-1A_MAKvit]|uniref:7-cyano-7-deazaguanine synthase QueC n=1 Tax=Nitratireductor sp. GISD-1A_MAKvit TaxID=3234198 RepID=UPI00346733F6